jgi:hypothetical protein
MLGHAMRISPGVTTFLKPYLVALALHLGGQPAYISATWRHLSPFPPVTSIVLSWRFSTSILNGVWDWTKFSSESGTPSFALNSATRALSCCPPPFVRRMKGMEWLWRYARASAAPWMGVEALRSTPSMLSYELGPSAGIE